MGDFFFFSSDCIFLEGDGKLHGFLLVLSQANTFATIASLNLRRIKLSKIIALAAMRLHRLCVRVAELFGLLSETWRVCNNFAETI